jgi:RNA polymerase sigma-70 factor, ECF subfamily
MESKAATMVVPVLGAPEAQSCRSLADPEVSTKPTIEEQMIALYDQLHGPVFRYVVSLGVHPTDADEVIQEAFLRLFEHLSKGGPAFNLRGWIFRVVHNIAFNERRDRRHFTFPSPEEWESLGGAVGISASPEHLLLERERMDRVHAQLSSLSPQQLRCLHLRLEGFRYRDIAEALDVTTATVCVMLKRALGKLTRGLHV